MSVDRKRVITVLVGDIHSELSAKTKYGFLLSALQKQVNLVEVYDASLKGLSSWLNAAQVFHPDVRRWKERYYQNTAAFALRSNQVSKYLNSIQKNVDIVFQIGVTLNSSWGVLSIPLVIYTDYTASLSTQKPEAGRSPFTVMQRNRQIALERQAFESASHIFTRSVLVRDSISDAYRIPPAKVTVVGGGVNFGSLPSIPLRRDDTTVTSLFIGKDFHRKGGDILLKAFARSRQKYPNQRLLMMTSGPIPSDLPRECVEILAPTWDRTIIKSLYQKADIFVLPSRLETWGDVFLEAMAYGIPCLAVANDAMPEIIVHGETGIIVPPEDIDALAAALENLCESACERAKLGRAGRERLELNFSWERVVSKMMPIMDRL